MSVRNENGSFGVSTIKSIPLSCANIINCFLISSRPSSQLQTEISNSTAPDSILDKSRIPFINSNKSVPVECIADAYSTNFGFSFF